MDIPHKPQSHLSEKALVNYDVDFCAWAMEQASLLRNGQIDKLDFANLAEEIESMGRKEIRELRNRLRLLLTHLLKWVYQPEKRKEGNSWRVTIRNNRTQINDLIVDSPCLKKDFDEVFEEAYQEARLDAEDETGLPLSTFPETCPWSATQVRDRDFWPGAPAEEILPGKKVSQNRSVPRETWVRCFFNTVMRSVTGF